MLLTNQQTVHECLTRALVELDDAISSIRGDSGVSRDLWVAIREARDRVRKAHELNDRERFAATK